MPAIRFKQLPVDARKYVDSDWLVYGETATPNTRAKLLALTVEEMVLHGPGGFNVKTVCDRIDAKYGLINYYFTNKELLIAEASAMTYRKSINTYKSIILAAPKDAEKRLRAFIAGEMEWFRKMGSWGLLASYPIHSEDARKLLNQNFGKELRSFFEFYLCLIGTLILDVRKGTLSNFDFDQTNFPRSFLLTHPNIVMDGVSMAWSAHGLNVWLAGQQMGSADLSTPKFTQKLLIDHHIDKMIKLAKG